MLHKKFGRAQAGMNRFWFICLGKSSTIGTVVLSWFFAYLKKLRYSISFVRWSVAKVISSFKGALGQTAGRKRTIFLTFSHKKDLTVKKINCF